MTENETSGAGQPDQEQHDQQGGSSQDTSQKTAPMSGFFAWLRELNLVRTNDRWLGGVCGAISQRTGLDVLVIRGIMIVALILGGPALLLYAVAWLLLPDAVGRIHLEQLIRGQADRTDRIVGIAGIVLVVVLLPTSQGLWWGDVPQWWGMPDWLGHLLRLAWGLAVLSGLVWLTVWIVQQVMNRGGNEAGGGTAGGGETPTDTSGGYQSTGGASFSGAGHAQTQGVVGGDSVGSHQAAYSDHGLQPTTYRPVTAEKTGPGAGFVAVAVGLALICGAVVGSLLAESGSWADEAVLLSLVTGLAVLGLAIVVAGIRGRESGWLGFFACCSLVGVAIAGIAPSPAAVNLIGEANWSVNSASLNGDRVFIQGIGRTTLTLSQPVGSLSTADGAIDMWSGIGETVVNIPDSGTVIVETYSFVGNSEIERDEGGLGQGGVLMSKRYVVTDGELDEASLRDPTGRPVSAATVIRVWSLIGNTRVSLDS